MTASAATRRNDRRRVAVVLPVLAACLVPVVGGCGRDCRSTSLSVTAVSSAGSLTARLRSDGEPVAGKRITFLVDSTGSSGRVGQLAGYANTGRDGRATLTVRGGLAAFVGPADRPTGVRVEFGELGGAEAYCDAKADRSVSD